MKNLRFFIILLLVYLACKNKPTTSIWQQEQNNYLNNQLIDSLKWLFYAYTFDGIVDFKSEQNRFQTKPIECEIKVDTVVSRNDTLYVNFSYYKENYKYSHLYEGLMVYGFVFSNGIAKPLTGNVILENFEDPSYVRSDNRKTDSMFRNYLKTIDTSKLHPWIFNEAKRRNIW